MAYIKIKGEKPSYTITLNKTSADLTITNGNPNYSLKGAVYYVYKDVNIPDYPYWDHEPYATFTTDANGHAELSKKLQSSNYVTFEAVAPKGYCADSKTHKFTVTGETTLNVVDDPGTIVLSVHKKDSETDSDQASGNASLAGAVYRVSYLVDGQMVCKDITTNSKGVTGLNKIPLGQITVQEITAPIGYKLDPTVMFMNSNRKTLRKMSSRAKLRCTSSMKRSTTAQKNKAQSLMFTSSLRAVTMQPKRPSATISPPAQMAWQPQRTCLTAHTSCIKQRAATAVSSSATLML